MSIRLHISFCEFNSFAFAVAIDEELQSPMLDGVVLLIHIASSCTTSPSIEIPRLFISDIIAAPNSSNFRMSSCR